MCNEELDPNLRLKLAVKEFLDAYLSKGIIEETGQSYTKYQMTSLFRADKAVMENILEKLKKLSE